MARISAEDGQAYLTRWQLVQDAEAAELRRTPMELKLRQLAALVASRDIFDVEPDRDLKVQEVRARWVRLRRALGG